MVALRTKSCRVRLALIADLILKTPPGEGDPGGVKFARSHRLLSAAISLLKFYTEGLGGWISRPASSSEMGKALKCARKLTFELERPFRGDHADAILGVVRHRLVHDILVGFGQVAAPELPQFVRIGTA